MKKKGISAVVATILIILIVVAGVGIVWQVILPLFRELSYFSYSEVQLDIVLGGFTVYDPAYNFAFVQIERGNDDVNVTGLEIGFSFNGTTKTYQTRMVPSPNGKYTYSFNFTADGIYGIPGKVTVAPIFILRNKVRLGEILDGEDMPIGPIWMSEEEWERANEGAVNILVIHPGPGDTPGVPIEPEEPGCVATGVEVCGNGIDEDCENGADDGCDVAGYFFEGEGVSADPYMIENCFQLQNMSYKLGGYYDLKKNIDCSMTSSWDDGDGDGVTEGFDPIGDSSLNAFTGSFDGKGFEINGLFINRPDENFIGLFGYININVGEIKNLGMIDSDITGVLRVGGIAGYSYYSTIIDSYNTGSITGVAEVGGIAGYSSRSTIIDSYNTGLITGSRVGGIAGASFSSTITNSYNTGLITGTSSVGGIAGYSYSSIITNSYNTGSITGTSSVGGIAGVSYLPITNSYNTGSITGTSSVGGIVGFSYSSITNSYYLDTSCSYAACNSEGISKIGEELKQNSTYPLWDFIGTWAIDETNSYPYLIENEQVLHPGL